MAEALDTEETRVFDADVGRILDIVAHALYSEREVFLRELIANAADACDKRRFLAQTDEALAEGPVFKQLLRIDKYFSRGFSLTTEMGEVVKVADPEATIC